MIQRLLTGVMSAAARAKILLAGIALTGVVLAICFAWPHIDFFMLTGHSSPIAHIETVRHPVAAGTWGQDGLLLADGRTIRLRGLLSLPARSDALSEATKHGVEVESDGRVWALVRVRHWCGNDPVREHVARLDLAEILIFLRVGEPVNPLSEISGLPEPGGSFPEMGWNVGEFGRFTAWELLRIIPKGSDWIGRGVISRFICATCRGRLAGGVLWDTFNLDMPCRSGENALRGSAIRPR